MRFGSIALGAVAAALSISSMSSSSRGAILETIATSGHDQDVVFEVGLASGATGANGEVGSRQFFEDGATGGEDDGLLRTLPDFTSALTGNTIRYAFEPFEQNNILKFTNGTANKSLTFDAPAGYTELAFVFTGGSLTTATEVATVTYTIRYAGGTTQVGTFNVPDWGAAPMPTGTEELFNADRTNANQTAAPVTTDNNTTAGRWSINVAQIVVSQPELNIESIEFGPITLNDADGQLNSGDDVAIWGVAGAPVPEPATTLVLALGSLALMRRNRR